MDATLNENTLTTTSGGDYASMTGEPFVKKLILRRLISKPGDFFHLPNYGIGLRVKEPLPNTDLRKLAKAIEMQVAMEPEVLAVKASLSYASSSAILYINLKVQLRQTGQIMPVSLAVSNGQVVL